MQNVLKQLGERVTAFPDAPFFRARISLTILYTALLAIILLVANGSTYSRFSRQLERRFEHSRIRPAIVLPDGILIPNSEDVRKDLIDAILFVNGILLVIAAILSYGLAGMTLWPIQEAYERQRRFLSDASHELRTPLAILRTDLENELAEIVNTNVGAEYFLPSDVRDEAKNRVRIESQLEEVERMGRLVNDLLTLSRLDEGGRRVFIPVDIDRVTKAAVDRLLPLAEREHVKVGYEASSDRVEIFGEPELLLQAITNIVRNAILYNRKEGVVHVVVDIVSGEARVVVRDTGVGIAPADLQNIFDRFYRADVSRTRSTGGSGLGLSIAKSIVESCNGNVTMESVPGEGTTVTLTFPVHTPSR